MKTHHIARLNLSTDPDHSVRHRVVRKFPDDTRFPELEEHLYNRRWVPYKDRPCHAWTRVPSSSFHMALAFLTPTTRRVIRKTKEINAPTLILPYSIWTNDAFLRDIYLWDTEQVVLNLTLVPKFQYDELISNRVRRHRQSAHATV